MWAYMHVQWSLSTKDMLRTGVSLQRTSCPLSLRERLILGGKTFLGSFVKRLSFLKVHLQYVLGCETLSPPPPPPPPACMREQLAQALATQQTVLMERDQAREQLKLAQDRGTRLQRQLDNLRTAYGRSPGARVECVIITCAFTR